MGYRSLARAAQSAAAPLGEARAAGTAAHPRRPGQGDRGSGPALRRDRAQRSVASPGRDAARSARKRGPAQQRYRTCWIVAPRVLPRAASRPGGSEGPAQTPDVAAPAAATGTWSSSPGCSSSSARTSPAAPPTRAPAPRRCLTRAAAPNPRANSTRSGRSHGAPRPRSSCTPCCDATRRGASGWDGCSPPRPGPRRPRQRTSATTRSRSAFRGVCRTGRGPLRPRAWPRPRALPGRRPPRAFRGSDAARDRRTRP